MQQAAADYTQLDDNDLLARHDDRTRLSKAYDALTVEFDRRARAAWAAADKTREQ